MNSDRPNDEPYWLGRASEEVQRLVKQHFIWTKSIGYLIHPNITARLPVNARIADIGTGTGIWLTEAAKVSPSTYQFDGYDISSAAFLPQETVPSNVSLQIGDFKQPFPEELHGKYDLVAIRLIIISMGGDVWRQTLQNILPLLKPGGAIQWIEGNFFVSRGFRGAEPSSSPGHYLTRIQRQLNSTLNQRFGFNFPDFEELYAGEGLQDVEIEVLSTDRLVEQRREFTQIGLGAVAGGLGNLAKAGGDGYWSAEEVEEYKTKAIADMESGAYFRWDISVSVGFKGKEESA